MCTKVCPKVIVTMNFKVYAVFMLVVMKPVFGSSINDNNTNSDFCGYELLTNLNGTAYTIEHVGQGVANKSMQLFYDRMHHEHNVLQFKILFGDDLIEVLKTTQWYYSFETVGLIHRNPTVPKSFQCIYGDDWGMPLNQSSAAELNFLTHKFYSFDFHDRLRSQIPSNVPLPIFHVNGSSNYTIWSNFAKTSYNNTEYFIIMLYYEDDIAPYIIIQLKESQSSEQILM